MDIFNALSLLLLAIVAIAAGYGLLALITWLLATTCDRMFPPDENKEVEDNPFPPGDDDHYHSSYP